MSRESVGGRNFVRLDRDFMCGGTRCAAWLYLPEGSEKPPVVVMAHGFGAERTFGLPPFAERFAAEGLAVLLFDYRNFGDSGGEPRYLVNPWRHLRDWEAALEHAASLPEVDGGRIGLWGSSYSGGHVMVTAARRPEVRALVAQVPFVSGPASALRGGARHALQATVEGLKDVAGALAGREPHYVPIVADPNDFGIMNTPESKPGYMAIVPPDSDWRNECPARAVLQLLFYRPGARARRVKCPALVILGNRDSLIPPRSVERAASRMREVTIIHLEAGHFDVYRGDCFALVVEREAEFLARHLLKKR
jgi:pimeloyl-ACP methyl ester carboxylesterase